MSELAPGAATGPQVDAVLDELEAGRLTVRRAVSLLAPSPPPVRGRRVATWLRFEIGNDGRRWGFRLPVLPVAVLLVGLELVAYPLAWAVLRSVAQVSGAGQLRQAMDAVPAFPVSRLMMTIVGAGAPFGFSAWDGDDGVLMYIE